MILVPRNWRLALDHLPTRNNLVRRDVSVSSQSCLFCEGRYTQFWNDGWIKDRGPLKNIFPRLYALETQKGCYVSEMWVIEDGVWQGKWAWRMQPSGRAEVSSLCQVIQKQIFVNNDVPPLISCGILRSLASVLGSSLTSKTELSPIPSFKISYALTGRGEEKLKIILHMKDNILVINTAWYILYRTFHIPFDGKLVKRSKGRMKLSVLLS
nr:RNA-directed DNA polymerase, eukaryota, reverse transcriptase zinc-binding domain protein [Tanacetum cinerariifolium]